MEKILFLEGTHGNFLARCLSVASGSTEDFNFYKDSIGAHNEDFTKVVDYNHYFNEYDIFCYINFNLDDLYILCWHNYFANWEFGLDLLKANTFKDWKKHLKGREWHTIYPGAKNHIDILESSGVSGLREMYKKYHTSFYLIDKQNDLLNKHNVKKTFQFKWFYNKDTFITQLKLLLADLGYEYRVDISDKWIDFIRNKNKIIQSKELVQYVFSCYTKNIPINITNLTVYEQAYLDHLIEQYLGYEIELWQDYPTNTKHIKPVKAWQGKRYDI